MNPVLHTLRCMGHAGLERIADAAGLSVAAVESELIDLAVNGLVTREHGAWGLTEAGHVADARQAADELDAAGMRTVVGTAYEKFLLLNPELLDLCSAWQLRPADPAYEERVFGLFGDLDGRAAVVIDELTAALPRFGRYRRRLGAALERARAGATEELADSLTSYHVVWFQLHEDLLVTLGKRRG